MQKQVKQYKISRRIRRFFSKSPSPSPAAFRGNKKGQGFHLFKRPVSEEPTDILKKRLLAGAAVGTATGGAILIAVALTSTPEIAFLVSAILALSGLVCWDLMSRYFWEQKVSMRLDKMMAAQDRLVCETARNRSDIGMLKDGLGELARSLEAQGKNLGGSSSPQAKVFDGLVTKLNALGSAPRAALGTAYDSDILELEMAPPPLRPPPRSELDSELSTDAGQYSDAVVAELVRHAVRHDKIELYLQPIVALPQRKPRMLEVYTRIRAGNGNYLPASRYLDLAQQSELMPALDNLLLMRTLQLLKGQRNAENAIPYVLNISGAALNDRAFMGDLVAFLSAHHKMAEQIIFELPQKDLLDQSAALAPVMDGLARLGVRFSLDRVRNRRIDIALLKNCRVRFIKLDAQWLLTEARSREGFSRILRLKKQFDAAGIDLVVEQIEQETTLRELLDFNIDYGQGYLFGKPDQSAAFRTLKAAA